jgi:hypothetical protein
MAVTGLGSVRIAMSRSFDGIFRHLDDFATASLLFVGSLRQGGMHLGQGIQHCLVQRGLICMHSGGMLAQIVESGKGFSAMARKGSFSGVFSTRQLRVSGHPPEDIPDVPSKMLATCEHLVALAIPSATEHFSTTDTNRHDWCAVWRELSTFRSAARAFRG